MGVLYLSPGGARSQPENLQRLRPGHGALATGASRRLASIRAIAPRLVAPGLTAARRSCRAGPAPQLGTALDRAPLLVNQRPEQGERTEGNRRAPGQDQQQGQSKAAQRENPCQQRLDRLDRGSLER